MTSFFPRQNEKLTEIMKKQGSKKLISVEVTPYKPIDYNRLAEINPNFCSVTWIVTQNDPKNYKLLPPMIVTKELITKGYVVVVHIPAIFYSEEEMRNILLTLKKYGVRNIFAMRGGGPWLKIENCDFPYVTMFLDFVRKEFGSYFEIIIAGFPHIHPSAGSMEDEMFFLRKKVQAGATMICTQACMCASRYLNYKQICTQYAIDIPIIFGLLILKSYNDFLRIKKMSFCIDRDIYKEAILSKRGGKSKKHGREWTRTIIAELLQDDLTVALHIFSQNNFELVKNILHEANAYSSKANLKQLYSCPYYQSIFISLNLTFITK